MEKKSAYIVTTTEGCATNLLENASYRKLLELSEIENVATAESADVIVINTCAYTTNQEERSLETIKNYQRKFPNKEVVVGGCLTKINSEKLNTVYKGKTFQPGNIEQFKESLNIKNNFTEKDIDAHFFDNADFVDLTIQHKLMLFVRPIFYKLEKLFRHKVQPLHNILQTAIVNEEYYGITVSQGCAGKCTFCSIKMAKGHVKSKTVVEIMHEFQKGIDLGHRRLWLLGDDIGCYGLDIGTNFSKLLKELLSINQNFELVINYFEPYFFLNQFDEILPLLKDKRILNINFPIQAGNSRIVERMGREYDPKLVLEKIKILKNENPNLVVKTNIIVGFPGESRKEFLDSVKAVFSFDAILALKFTAREKTLAFKMDDQISEFEKRMRMQFINSVVVLRHAIVFFKSFFNIESLNEENSTH